ncbi:MAG: ABC transporter ATP-binding protein, partial [Candidatus Thiodiazotropha sp.]
DEAVLVADRALIMAGSPGKIYDELEVNLPDPRERHDTEVQAMRTRLMEAFKTAANEHPSTSSKDASDESSPHNVTQHA